MSKWTDRARPVRAEEGVEIGRLGDYLQAQLPALRGELVVEQFPSGFSNLTYLLRVGETELVLRRPPFGANVQGGHDMQREYTILSRLYPVYGKVPEPLLYCADPDVIGAEFYIMRRVRGVILRPEMPPGMAPDADVMRRISHALVDELVALHAIDLAAAGLGDFGKPEGYVARQIEGWARRWHKAQTDPVPAMDAAADWLAANLRPESAATLIHNDFKYDNFVLDPHDWSRIIAVLDWEMATVGDPLMDLGTSLSYWVEADDPPIMAALRLSPTTLPGNLTRREVVTRYAAQSGRNVDAIVFYYVYGLFKLGVIVQQIYRRWKLGYTKDTRFAALLTAVEACGNMAVQTIGRGQI